MASPLPQCASLAAANKRSGNLLRKATEAGEAIAAELDVHSCTVSNHLANVRRKLGRHSVADLVAYALAEGLLDAPPPTD